MPADEVIETLDSPGQVTEVLAEGVDERGAFVRFRHRTHRRGRMAGPHWHPVLTEQFSIISGVLRMVIDGETVTPSAGQTVTVTARQAHEFSHDGPDEVVFEHEVRPPGQHRAMFELMHCLDVTGRLTKTGLPRNPLAVGLLWGMQDGYILGPSPRLQDLLLGGLDRLARRLGLHRRLAIAVGREPDHWERPSPGRRRSGAPSGAE